MSVRASLHAIFSELYQGEGDQDGPRSPASGPPPADGPVADPAAEPDGANAAGAAGGEGDAAAEEAPEPSEAALGIERIENSLDGTLRATKEVRTPPRGTAPAPHTARPHDDMCVRAPP